jgi:hypothetical protein
MVATHNVNRNLELGAGACHNSPQRPDVRELTP